MLKKIYRLKKRKEYKNIYKKGKKYIGKYISIYVKHNDKKRIGFSVSKKIGNAVTRNLYKRRFRNIIKKYFLLLNNEYYIIVANKKNDFVNYKELEKDIFLLLKKIKNFKDIKKNF